jgi:hypothetical protein
VTYAIWHGALNHIRCSKILSARRQQAKSRGVPLWCVEPLREARPPLAVFFSILLEAAPLLDQSRTACYKTTNRVSLSLCSHY